MRTEFNNQLLTNLKFIIMETLFEEKVKEQNFYDGLIPTKNMARTEIKMVSPQIAKNWLTVNTINRRVNDKLIIFYANQMTRGLWEFNGEPIIFSDTHKLLDGQHRLMAIIRSGVTLPMVIIFNIKESTFPTIDRGRNRTMSDVLDITGISNSTNITSTIRKYFAIAASKTPSAGVTMASVKGTELNMSPQEYIAFYNKHSILIQEIFNESNKYYKISRLLTSTEVAAYILFLHLNKNHSLDKMYNFFKQLLTGRDIENETIFQLRQRLISSKTSINKITGKYRYALIIKTWNAYVKNKSIRTLKFNSDIETMPEFI